MIGDEVDDVEDENLNLSNVSASNIVSPSKVIRSTLEVDPKVEEAYKIIRKVTGVLGGNGSTGAIYGELTLRALQRVYNIMTEKCNLTKSSRMIDVGAGLGKPNFHAAQDPAVRLSLGMELEDIRWNLSMHNLEHFLKHVEDDIATDGDSVASLPVPTSSAAAKGKKNKTKAVVEVEAEPVVEAKSSKKEGTLNGGVNFVLNDIDNAHSLDPFTHIYMFDLGFPPPLQKSIAKKFNNSVHAECLVSYRPPRRVIKEYGYAVTFVDQVLCSMHGSGEGHTAYIYMRANKAPKVPTLPNQRVLSIPGRTSLNEPDNEVYCDETFYEASRLAVGPVAELKEYVSGVVNKHLDGARSQRVRKPRVISEATF